MTESPRSSENRKFITDRGVVVTGLGMISPLGLNVESNWKRLIAGETGIVPINIPFVENIKVAGLVKNFDPKTALDGFVEQKALRRISLSAQYALSAAIEACKEAGLFDRDKLKGGIDPNKAGVEIGTGIGGGFHIAEVSEKVKEGKKCTPSDILLILPERVASVVSMSLGFKGPGGMPSAACATGNYAITLGYNNIKRNADIMLVGGAESTVNHVSLNAFDAARALSRESDPQKSSRPFDKERNGFVMGEGAAVMVLEEREHAIKRGAGILAEMIGYGNTLDAYSDTAPNGEGAERAMEEAIEGMGGLPKEGVIYVHAHGTGTQFDDVEISAIRNVFMDRHGHKDIAVSSTKGATGHMIGGAGAAGAIFSILALREGILPPTINLDNPMDEARGINLVPNQAQKVKPVVVFNNSFGFGGFNVVTVFGRSED